MQLEASSQGQRVDEARRWQPQLGGHTTCSFGATVCTSGLSPRMMGSYCKTPLFQAPQGVKCYGF